MNKDNTIEEEQEIQDDLFFSLDNLRTKINSIGEEHSFQSFDEVSDYMYGVLGLTEELKLYFEKYESLYYQDVIIIKKDK